MQLHPSGRLFAAWDGLYCIDVSEDGIKRAVVGSAFQFNFRNIHHQKFLNLTCDKRPFQDGKSTRTLELNLSSEDDKLFSCREGVLSTTDARGGVVLLCEATLDDDVRVIPLGGGYAREIHSFVNTTDMKFPNCFCLQLCNLGSDPSTRFLVQSHKVVT